MNSDKEKKDEEEDVKEKLGQNGSPSLGVRNKVGVLYVAVKRKVTAFWSHENRVY